MSHVCPVKPCGPRELSDEILMCAAHWRHVPKPLQRAVYYAYKNGAGVGTPALVQAQQAAIRAASRE